MNTDERRAWGPLLREARKSLGLTLEEVERDSTVSRRTISDIERGNKVGQPAKLVSIMEALGIDPPETMDPDVENFAAMLRPLLQRLTPDERAEVMPEITRLVAERLRPARHVGGAGENLTPPPD